MRSRSLPSQELHHVERGAAEIGGSVCVGHAGDVLVRDTCGRASLSPEPLDGALVTQHVRVEDLQRE